MTSRSRANQEKGAESPLERENCPFAWRALAQIRCSLGTLAALSQRVRAHCRAASTISHKPGRGFEVPRTSKAMRAALRWPRHCSTPLPFLTFLSLIALAGCAASPPDSPAAVTDLDIQRYQFSLYQDCRDAGARHGEPQSKIEVFCNCASETLKREVGRSDWQIIVFYALNKRDSDEMQSIAPFMKRIVACRALPPAPAGSPSAPSLIGTWEWSRPPDRCREVYTFREDGTVRIESGNERSENTYQLSDKPESSGRYQIMLRTTKYLSGLNCDGSSHDTTGEHSLLYVLFGPSNETLAICQSLEGLDCIGPLKRVIAP